MNALLIRLSRRLITLAVGASFALIVLAMGALFELQERQESARAQLVTQTLAVRIASAANLGIPIKRIVGINDVFREAMRTDSSIVAISLQERDGFLLESATRDKDTPALSGTSTSAPVMHHRTQIAVVQLTWQPTGMATLVYRWILPLGSLVTSMAFLAMCGLGLSWSSGFARRNKLVLAACRRICAGDLTVQLDISNRNEFDSRLSWLAGELRHVNEQFQRVGRLVQSLTATEPDLERQQELQQILKGAYGRDKFRDASRSTHEYLTFHHDAGERLHGIVIAALCWVFASLVPPLVPTSTGALPFILFMILAMLSFFVLVITRRSGSAGYRKGLMEGFGAVGPGLAIPLLLVVDPNAYLALGLAGSTLLFLCTGFSVVLLTWGPRRVRSRIESRVRAT